MIKVKNALTGDEKTMSRDTWEQGDSLYKSTWAIIDEGDPVFLFQRNSQMEDFVYRGKADREHAVKMVKTRPEQFYFLESLPDDLKTLSPVINTAAQQVQPSKKPKSKSSHDTWDKIKYVSTIIGALGVVIGAIGKFFGLW